MIMEIAWEKNIFNLCKKFAFGSLSGAHFVHEELILCAVLFQRQIH